MVINKFVLVIGCAMLFALCACSRQQSDWQKARETNTPEAYEQFLKKYPSGEFTAQAQARAKELVEERDWQKARDVDTLEAYQAFLKQYPEGKWTEEARIRVENFTLAQTPAGAAPGGTAGAPPGAAAAAPAPAPTAAAPTAAAAPARTAGAASQSKAGSYGIQLGAFKSGAAAANRRWAHLQKEYPKLLAGLSSTVAPKKTATGMLYRLQAFGVSEKRARAICKDLKAHSQACVVIRPAHA
ncbi:MAG: SPOR domain-containing protein [Steroidobacteraceae bacterium]